MHFIKSLSYLSFEGLSSQSECGLLDFCQITILQMDPLIMERVVADHFTLRVHLLMVEGFCLPIHFRDLPVNDGKVINDS